MTCLAWPRPSGSRPSRMGQPHTDPTGRSPANTVGATDRSRPELHPETTPGTDPGLPGTAGPRCSLLTAEMASEARPVQSHRGKGVLQGQFDKKETRRRPLNRLCALCRSTVSVQDVLMPVMRDTPRSPFPGEQPSIFLALERNVSGKATNPNPKGNRFPELEPKVASRHFENSVKLR